jgi:thymidylate synthase (FAD)
LVAGKSGANVFEEIQGIKMRIIQPSFKLSTPSNERLTRDNGIEMLRFIERQARISHRSEEKMTEDSWERFITAVVINHGDWSVTEHASITATLRVDRGVTHELVRHRLFSFTQESTRFVRYKEELDFIYPFSCIVSESSRLNWEKVVSEAEDSYHSLLLSGWRPQEARSVLPNALAATIAVTGNLRNWRWFLLARTTKETHPDFRRITIPMLEELKKVVPILYEDIEPEARQIDNARKAR